MRREGLSAWLYSFVWAATLVSQLAGLAALGNAAGLALLTFLLLEFSRQRRYAQVLFLAFLAAGMVGVAEAHDPLALFLAGWRRGAVYAAFFYALGALRDAAETSPLVRRCGRHLVAQPPGRRYAALSAGGHLFGIILSYGVMELFGAMVARANTLAAAGGIAEVQALRGRRMLMAVYRGFAAMNCWSPLNIMTAVVSTAVPGAPMRLLMPFAFLVSLASMAAGWLEDRRTAARLAARLPPGRSPPPASDERWSVHLRIAGLVLLVMALAEGSAWLFAVPLVGGVTMAVPAVGFGWIVAQARAQVGRLARGRPGAAQWRLLGRVLRRRLRRFLLRVPGFRGEATILGASGFVGITLGALLPTLLPTLGGGPGGPALPPILLPLTVPVILIATGQIGLNPIAVVALIGAAIPHPAALGVPASVLAFSAMLGWGLAINVTPMSATAIATARWAGVDPWTICTTWNARYAAGALVLTWLAIALAWAVVFTAG
jgi:hypothetical protein